jgi:hypothetical protein
MAARRSEKRKFRLLRARASRGPLLLRRPLPDRLSPAGKPARAAAVPRGREPVALAVGPAYDYGRSVLTKRASPSEESAHGQNKRPPGGRSQLQGWARRPHPSAGSPEFSLLAGNRVDRGSVIRFVFEAIDCCRRGLDAPVCLFAFHFARRWICGARPGGRLRSSPVRRRPSRRSLRPSSDSSCRSLCDSGPCPVRLASSLGRPGGAGAAGRR